MKVVVEQEAAAELSAAAEWYDRERDGLGSEMLLEVGDALDAIAERPRSWPLASGHSPVRRFVLSRFPYVIYYVVRSDHVLILAVGHSHRRPGYWLPRMRGSGG